MKYINRKEQVIDLQLTQYGKYLLSKGKLKPVYYNFLDDDIIYDSEYYNNIEEQNYIETRIKEETPYLETQYVFHGIETEVKKHNKLVRSKQNKLNDEKIQPVSEKHYSLSAPLGNSSISTQYYPAFKVDFLEGKIVSSVNYVSSSFFPSLLIPQISSSIVYKTSLLERSTINESRDKIEDEFIINDEYSVKIEKNNLILQIEEKNVDFNDKNFDIEVFEIKNNIDGKEELIPLYFLENSEDFNNKDIFIEDDSISNNISLKESQVENVEYYFDINIDREIDINDFNIKNNDKLKRNLYINNNDLDITTIENLNKKEKEDYYRTPSGRFVKDEEECKK